MNVARNPSANSIGVSKRRFPRHSVASQLKILMPVGTAMIIELSMKKPSRNVGSPTVNMWWAQTSIEQEPDGDRRDRDRGVAEDRFPREHRDHLGDDPHRRQDHDVDLGVPEEPEDVPVEDRVPAVVG